MLLHVALGDRQVSELTAFDRRPHHGRADPSPVVADGRSHAVDLGWGLEPIEYPSDGSGLVFWDSGAELIPVENLPPQAGEDPHERSAQRRRVRSPEGGLPLRRPP